MSSIPSPSSTAPAGGSEAGVVPAAGLQRATILAGGLRPPSGPAAAHGDPGLAAAPGPAQSAPRPAAAAPAPPPYVPTRAPSLRPVAAGGRAAAPQGKAGARQRSATPAARGEQGSAWEDLVLRSEWVTPDGRPLPVLHAVQLRAQIEGVSLVRQGDLSHLVQIRSAGCLVVITGGGP